jgi:hypothetical protein
MSKRTSTTDHALTQLANQINVGHQQCLRAARTSLEHARQTGTFLLEAKERVLASGQKNWLDWVQSNCKCSVAEAQRYMRVANHYGQLRERGQDLTKLSLTQALRLLSPAEGAGKGRRSKARPFTVPSRAEVNHLARKAEGLAVPEDSPERRFLDGTVAGLVQRLLAQARKTHLTDAKGQSVSPPEVAIALLEQLKEALHVGLVVREKPTERPRAEAPRPANGSRVNGKARAAG